MKIIVFLMIILSCLSTVSRARSLETATSVVYGDISMSIAFEIANHSIPISWEGVPRIQEMLKNPTSSSYYFKFKVINSMALIPGAPTIQQEEGIPNKYVGCRLFAVSRDSIAQGEAIDPTTGKLKMGRYCVSINGTDHGSMGNWLTESEAQLIFKQFNNFDPKKQSLAFEETIAENGKPSYKLRVESTIPNSETITQPTTHQKEVPTLQTQSSELSSSPRFKEEKTILTQPGNYRFAWVIAGIIFLTGSIGFMIRQKKNS
jgi:hypothetical protein